MADTRISELTALSGADVASTDEFVVVDKSDTTMAASGTDKRVVASGLPSIPALANAFDAAGAATSAVTTHAGATDPHGDRAYAAALVDDLSGVTNAATARANIGAAPLTPSFLTLGTNSELTTERVLTAGTNITLTDGGAGSTLTIAASGGGVNTYSVGGQIQLKKSARYYPRLSATYGNVTLGADYVYFAPLVLAWDATADRIAISITSAAASGKKVRLGIYSSHATTYEPTTVLASGIASADATGEQNVTVSQALTAGTVYWLAAQAEANITVNGWTNVEMFGNTVISPQGNNQGRMYVASAYSGGLPASPSVTHEVAASTLPVLQVRIA